ncbi:hypothetical protein [Streptomyces benahoarensis]|uniref:Uncharacterized protein n=1 Tax=Streptomyces benahoarensis TaxID=2595054 RepID=A0A553XF29_9ACTN|nr:hypothetical protein [Streptomyces benahoarensis]TSB07399.1 hypothetical protein FNJ62_31140 [Streptomyces benahoarensis]TSB15483.1 hypothetical protein FNZ23_30925 [Streptomyces benahoarensis]
MKSNQYLPRAVSLGAGAVIATTAASSLAPYALPGHLLATCVMSAGASGMWLANYAIDRVTVRSLRCTAAECTLTVRLRGTDAAESRRWQEAVADHPQHRLPH